MSKIYYLKRTTSYSFYKQYTKYFNVIETHKINILITLFDNVYILTFKNLLISIYFFIKNQHYNYLEFNLYIPIIDCNFVFKFNIKF